MYTVHLLEYKTAISRVLEYKTAISRGNSKSWHDDVTVRASGSKRNTSNAVTCRSNRGAQNSV
jgi:hypothetical protein